MDHRDKKLPHWLPIKPPERWPPALWGLLVVVFTLFWAMALVATSVVIIRTITEANTATGLGAGALIVAILSLPLVLWNTYLRQKTVNFQQEGHITDRIHKAVEMLGAEKTVKTDKGEVTRANIEMRIGALLSLERISQDSVRYDQGRDHVRVMEILCAYIRHNAPASEAVPFPEELQRDDTGPEDINSWEQSVPKPSTDIQLALDIIGRRDAAQRACEYRGAGETAHLDRPPPYPDNQAENAEYLAARKQWRKARKQSYCLDLRDCNLQRADLTHANLTAARLERTELQGATLTYAHLQGAELQNANLQNAMLWDTNLQNAYLQYANLQNAYLFGADLQGIDLTFAKLQKAKLSSANLRGAILSFSNLRNAFLLNANLQEASIYDAKFSPRTIFENPTLTHAEWQNSDCRMLSVTQEQFAAGFGDGSVRLPKDCSWPAHWPIWHLTFDELWAEHRKWRDNPENYRPPAPPAEYTGPLRGVAPDTAPQEDPR